MDDFTFGYIWACIVFLTIAAFICLRYRLVRRTSKHKK